MGNYLSKKMNKSIVVLVNEVVGSVLATCRTLKRQYGVKTYVVCINSNYKPIFQCSRYVDYVFQIQAPDSSCLLNEMKDWYHKQNFHEPPILYFTDDHSCNLVNEQRDWYEQHFQVCLPSSFIVDSFTHKGIAENIAEQNGLLVPQSKIAESSPDIQEIYDTFNFPVIIKPRCSELKKGLPFKKAKILAKDEFKEYTLPIIEKKATFICQEYIPGGDDKSYFYLFNRNREGNITECMGVKVLQSPPGQGIMAIGKTAFNPCISQISQNFLNRINYIGIGGIEYKEYNNQYYFIEMNTRIEAIIQITDDSNVSIPTDSYLNYKTLSSPATRNKSQKDNVFYIDLVPFIKAKINQRKFISLFTDFIRICFSPSYKFNILSWKDPLPFFVNVAVVFNNKVLHHKK